MVAAANRFPGGPATSSGIKPFAPNKASPPNVTLPPSLLKVHTGAAPSEFPFMKSGPYPSAASTPLKPAGSLTGCRSALNRAPPCMSPRLVCVKDYGIQCVREKVRMGISVTCRMPKRNRSTRCMCAHAFGTQRKRTTSPHTCCANSWPVSIL